MDFRTCSQCKHLDVKEKKKKKKKGKESGAYYYCTEKKSFVSAACLHCDKFKEEHRDYYDVRKKIEKEGKDYSDNTLSFGCTCALTALVLLACLIIRLVNKG